MPGNDDRNSIWFVGAGPGDPDLITVKGRALLDRADVLLYAGSLVNPDLVASSPAAEKVNSWGMHLDDIIGLMTDRVKRGKTVVRLHSGDPALFGSIVEQIAELKKLNITVSIVPGVSSVFAAAAALATEFTPRGVSETLIITRPAGTTLEKDYIPELSQYPATMAFFLGSEHFCDITQKLSCPKDTPAAVIFHASCLTNSLLPARLPILQKRQRMPASPAPPSSLSAGLSGALIPATSDRTSTHD
jgi:precorrin-4/cobalt-precorrin-4 C11-methyltransferase